MERILVTGAGGIGGVNFVRALRVSKEKFFIAGTDFNKYYLQFADLDIRINSPRHSDPNFVKLVNDIIEKNKISFVHPSPTSEAQVISQNKKTINAKMLLPEPEIISQDKLAVQKKLQENNIAVAKTKTVRSSGEIDEAFSSFGKGPVWIRAKKGAGGNLSLLCDRAEEAKHWISLWVAKKKADYADFMFQEYLSGKNLAWDSFWYEGKLVASFTRERIEYPFKHISPSGITGTPTVSKIVSNNEVNKIGEKAIHAIDKKPHGNYAVDLKGDLDDKFYVTEVDSGKFHTTTPLWGYISTKVLKQEKEKNLPYLYTMLGLGKITQAPTLGNDIYPDGTYLLRHIDCGDWIWREDGYKEQIL
jgi:carbamoyl-phosphate synthase large subunit